MSTKVDAVARRGFKYLNRFMLLMWRLGLQRWGMSNQYLGYIMVITHIGRKSGLARRTPVNYALIDGEFYCVAGFGAIADWYRNLVANPRVEVWLPESWWEGMAEDVSTWPAARQLPLLRQVLINSGFAAYAAGLDPRKMSDAELAKATAEYKLVRIHRTIPRTGPGGPSDLAWVWQVLAAVLALLLLLSKGRGQGRQGG
jgi:deazaflavin-dependent oxidoreductase (nitroreductase family)